MTQLEVAYHYGTAPGEAEMRALDLMRLIDRDSYRFEFCVLSGLRGALDEEIRALGGRVHYCRLDAAFPVKFKRLLQSPMALVL